MKKPANIGIIYRESGYAAKLIAKLQTKTKVQLLPGTRDRVLKLRI